MMVSLLYDKLIALACLKFRKLRGKGYFVRIDGWLVGWGREGGRKFMDEGFLAIYK